MHMIFDVNPDTGFTRNSRFIIDRHKVDTSPFMTYVSVVSRDSVRIVLILAAINGFSVKCANVQSKCLN